MKICLVIPVFNEEVKLPGSIAKLFDYCQSLQDASRKPTPSAALQLSADQSKERVPLAVQPSKRDARPVLFFDYEIIIANNGSTDRTSETANSLSRNYHGVHAVHLREKGRGRALKRCWMMSNANVLSYMDVDISTDLDMFPYLIEAVASGRFDLATASRLLEPKLVTRSLKREVISRCYNFLVHLLFKTKFSDAQCGFKSISKNAAEDLLPMIEDTGWFFDTELLILAERFGYRTFDFPARWIEDSDSRVRIFRTAIEDLRGLARMKRNLLLGRYKPKTQTLVCAGSSTGFHPKGKPRSAGTKG